MAALAIHEGFGYTARPIPGAPPLPPGWLGDLFWGLVSGSEAQFQAECSTRAEADSEPEALSPRSWVWPPSLSGLAESSHLRVGSPAGAAENSLDLITGEFSTAGAELRAKHNKQINKHKTLLFGRTLGEGKQNTNIQLKRNL